MVRQLLQGIRIVEPAAAEACAHGQGADAGRGRRLARLPVDALIPGRAGAGDLDPEAQVRRVYHAAVLGGGRHDPLTNASHEKKL